MHYATIMVLIFLVISPLPCVLLSAAHNVALRFAQLGLAPTYAPNSAEQRVNTKVSIRGLQFDSPIGLAAGFDKNGEAITPLLQMGFGFVEIGTVTPKPQDGNPDRPRMFRLKEDLAVINRYGFNSQGAQQVVENLQDFRKAQSSFNVSNESDSFLQQAWKLLYPPQPISGPLGVNIGKNKVTPNEIALEDYVQNIRTLGPYADYLVINVSSPNTPNLRNLQEASELKELLEACLEARNKLENRPPLMVKLAPDLTDDSLQSIAQVCLDLDLDGIVLTNTTNQRPNDLLSSNKGETGGLSGAPLRERSTEMIRKLYSFTKGQIPIVGVGGISNGLDAYQKFKAGASLVQIYSCMVYEGPGVVSRIRQELAQIMRQQGQKDLERDVIGRDHEELFWQKQKSQMENDRLAEGLIVLDSADDDGDGDQTATSSASLSSASSYS